jgi:hypothetical protein
LTYSLVAIVDASVDDADLGALALNAGSVQLVDARHVVIRIVAKVELAAEALGVGLAEEQLAGLPGAGDDGLVLDRVEGVLDGLDGAAAEHVVVEDLEHVDAGVLGQSIGGGSGISFLGV